MRHSEIINEIAAALAAAQGEFKAVAKDKTAKAGSYSYKYSDIADVLSMALPVLSKHKLALIQATDVDGGAIFLRTRLIHASGQWIESEYPVCDVRGGDHQKMGGALTYARRYAASSLLGIASDEDTDAQGAAEPAGRDNKRQSQAAPRQQERQQETRQQKASPAPAPGDKGVMATLMHEISLAETEADLEDWYKDPATEAALSSLGENDKKDVGRRWVMRRNELRQNQRREA